MTHPDTPEVGGEPDAPLPTPEERLNAAFGDEEPQDEELPAEEGEQPIEGAEDDLEIEEEADDLPPIEAPVSWDAEAKERFAKLPREDQEYLAKRETERERFVQQKSQEAARAKQESEQVAYQQLAQIEQAYAQQFQQVAQSLEMAEPDPMLLTHDPQTYAMQMRQYQQARAQREHAQQQAYQYAQQAQAREQQAEHARLAQEHQTIVEHFPEYADPTTGPKLQQELSAVAREMGYPPELIAQARAADILAMRTAADWKAKASKYDALMSQKMAKVREAKSKPKIARPGVAQAPGAQRSQQYAADREAMRRGDKDAATRVLDAFFDPNPR